MLILFFMNFDWFDPIFKKFQLISEKKMLEIGVNSCFLQLHTASSKTISTDKEVSILWSYASLIKCIQHDSILSVIKSNLLLAQYVQQKIWSIEAFIESIKSIIRFVCSE